MKAKQVLGYWHSMESICRMRPISTRLRKGWSRQQLCTGGPADTKAWRIHEGPPAHRIPGLVPRQGWIPHNSIE